MYAIFERLRYACLVLAFGSLSAAAASPGERASDYAQTIPLRVSGKQAVVQLALPRAVYFGARSPGLHDLRLFDASGTPMPFALVEQVQQERENRSTAPVSVFAIRGPAGSARLSEALEIRTGANGPVISVKAPAADSDSDVLVSLVLDLRGTAEASAPAAALTLTLPPGMNSYSAQLALDVSDDLEDWEEIGVASVNWLINSQGASVIRNRIAFPSQSLRFARLRWIEGKPLEFTAITAELVTQRRLPERWESVVLQPAPAEPGADLVYAAPPALPVQAIGLELQGQNIVMPVLVGQYRKTVDGGQTTIRLQPVTNTTFYQLTQNGQRRVSGDINVPLTHAAQWVVRPQTTVQEKPGLRLRWKPASLVFVASGTQPYSLAFGRDGVKSAQVPVSQVAPGFSVSELATLEQAVAGDPLRQHGGAQRDGADEARDASRARMLWLWALLLAGVTVLAFMAWKLLHQMKNGTGDPPPV